MQVLLLIMTTLCCDLCWLSLVCVLKVIRLPIASCHQPHVNVVDRSLLLMYVCLMRNTIKFQI